jgi:hypothetical protein
MVENMIPDNMFIYLVQFSNANEFDYTLKGLLHRIPTDV